MGLYSGLDRQTTGEIEDWRPVAGRDEEAESLEEMEMGIKLVHMEQGMFRAAVTGNTSVLDEINVVKNGENYFLERTAQKDTIAHLAAQHGHSQFVERVVIRFPVLLDCQNLAGEIPLHTAARHGDKETVRVLISHLCSSKPSSDWLMVQNSEGDTPYHVALKHENVEAADEFSGVIAENPDVLMVVNGRSETPLQLAARLSSMKTAKFIISHLQPAFSDRSYRNPSSMEPYYQMEAQKQEQMDEILYEAAVKGKSEWFGAQTFRQEYLSSRTPRGSSILHLAIENGQQTFLKAAVECCPALILAKDSNGDTPFHIAARFNNNASTTLLANCKCYLLQAQNYLNRPIEISPWEVMNLRGYTPLHEALRRGNIDIAFDILMNVVDRTWKDRYKNGYETPLHMLARYATNCSNRSKSIERLLELNDWAVYDRDSLGLNPLMRAAACGRVLVALLIVRNYPLSVEVRGPNGSNFLHYLCSGIEDDNVNEKHYVIWICKLILRVIGVDNLIFSQDNNGNTPLHIAIIRGDFTIAELMMQLCIELELREEFSIIINNEGKSVSALIRTGSRSPQKLKMLLEQAILGRTMRKETYEQCAKGDKNVIPQRDTLSDTRGDKRRPGWGDKFTGTMVLKANDYFYHCRAQDGGNVVHIAVQHDQVNLIKEVLKHFPHLICQSNLNGETPLHIAVRRQSKKALEFLEYCCGVLWQKALNDEELSRMLGYCPPWMVKSSKGNTLLHEAARHSNYEAMSLLLNYIDVADLSDVNDNGETPFHVFARYGTYTVTDSLEVPMKLMHRSHSVLYMRDGEGFTPLLAAAQCGRGRVVRQLVLLKWPLLANDRDYKGRTILHHLQSSGEELVDDTQSMLPTWQKILLTPEVDELRSAQDEDGNTPLHLAIMRADVIIAKFLLERCLQPESKRQELTILNNDGNSVFDMLASEARSDTDGLGLKSLFSQAQLSNDCSPALPFLSSQASIQDMQFVQKEAKDSVILNKRYVIERNTIAKMMDVNLYKAATEGNLKIFHTDAENIDLEKGTVKYDEAYFTAQTPDGSNILHLAIRHGNSDRSEVVQFAKEALDRFPSLILHQDFDGDTPLHLGAKLDTRVSWKVIERVQRDHVQHEENKSALALPWKMKNFKGNMPIHEALRTNNLRAAKHFTDIDHHAMTYVNDLGETPLHVHAKYYFCPEFTTDIQMETDTGAIWRNGVLILESTADEHFIKHCTSCLIEKNISAAFVRDGEGLTPLLRAAKCGRFRVVRAILQHCPQSAYLRDPDGRTFLHLIRFTGGDVPDFSADYVFERVRKCLFEIPEADAQRVVQDSNGNTPLHHAIKTSNFVAAEILAQRCLETPRRLEFHILNKEGESVIDLIASYEAPNEMVDLIRKKMPETMYSARSSYGIRKEEIKDTASSLSVIAGLLATITFSAAFQVPGGFNSDDGTPVLLRKTAFHVFLISDALAMCGSMFVLFSLLWVLGSGKPHNSFIMLDFSLAVLQASFNATLVAFMTGVFVSTSQNTMWLSILVCVLCSFVIMITWRKSMRLLVKFSKLGIDILLKAKNLFSYQDYKLWVDSVVGSSEKKNT